MFLPTGTHDVSGSRSKLWWEPGDIVYKAKTACCPDCSLSSFGHVGAHWLRMQF